MNTINILGKYLQKYISISGLSGSTYTYKARSKEPFPVVTHKLHKEKCKPGSWLYVALDSKADIKNIKNSDKLYIGSQTQDRMFRGDGLKGTNFHHLEMRKGNQHLNLINFLEAGNEVIIYRLGKDQLFQIAENEPDLKRIRPIISSSKIQKFTNSPGYWFEQIVLYQEKECWDWNTKHSDSNARAVIESSLI